MKIKLTAPLGGNNTGDTIDVPTPGARYLLDEGYAEEVKASPRSSKTPKPERNL